MTSCLQTHKDLFYLKIAKQPQTNDTLAPSALLSFFHLLLLPATSALSQSTRFWSLFPTHPHPAPHVLKPLSQASPRFLTVKFNLMVHSRWRARTENKPLFQGPLSLASPAKLTAESCSLCPPHYPCSPASFSGSSPPRCFVLFPESNVLLLDFSLSLSIGDLQHRPQISLNSLSP